MDSEKFAHEINSSLAAVSRVLDPSRIQSLPARVLVENGAELLSVSRDLGAADARAMRVLQVAGKLLSQSYGVIRHRKSREDLLEADLRIRHALRAGGIG